MSQETCQHSIGTAEVDYQLSIVSVGDRLMEYNGFYPFDFCPYCGKEVSAEAAAMRESIEAEEVKWEKQYGKRLGK